MIQCLVWVSLTSWEQQIFLPSWESETFRISVTTETCQDRSPQLLTGSLGEDRWEDRWEKTRWSLPFVRHLRQCPLFSERSPIPSMSDLHIPKTFWETIFFTFASAPKYNWVPSLRKTKTSIPGQTSFLVLYTVTQGLMCQSLLSLRGLSGWWKRRKAERTGGRKGVEPLLLRLLLLCNTVQCAFQLVHIAIELGSVNSFPLSKHPLPFLQSTSPCHSAMATRVNKMGTCDSKDYLNNHIEYYLLVPCGLL